MERLAANVVLGPEIKKLERQLKGLSKGLIKVDMKVGLPKPGSPPLETDDNLDTLHFPCCGETVKVARHNHHFCIICGTEVDMKISDAKQIFLSHKGVDKAQVIDFKRALELLAYDPWLDEDAMPAGTPLERGLLQGMQNSCGVVFFITPSFKDEGYLETEINYAIQEKRRKGDTFAIITLQFVDADGNMGEIPELLKTYVWKKPKTDLEAFREIIRALPVVHGAVDWRDEITQVATAPKTKTTSTELSDEAKKILRAAATTDGRVMHVRFLGGEQIQSGGQSLLPDQDVRTIARWSGGLEDLRRRRFVKDVGHKGEVFEVTREGYEAADELSEA